MPEVITQPADPILETPDTVERTALQAPLSADIESEAPAPLPLVDVQE